MAADTSRSERTALSVTTEEAQRQFFERLARRYDGRFCRARWPRNQRLKARVMADVLGEAALHGPVVELGCGQVAGELLARNPKLRYVGLDLSRSMLETARHRLRRHGDRVELRGVHGSLPLEPRSYAGAFGVDVLHHVDRPREVLAELHRALVPGASIVFLEGNPRFPLTALIAIVYRDERGLFGMTFRNLRAWLSAAGFESVRVEYGPLYTPPGPERIEPALDRIDGAFAKVPGIKSLAIFYTALARASRAEPVGGSGVSGFVQLTALPDGTNIHVHATGLTPGVTYSSFEYEASDCTGEFDLLGTFTANAAGIGNTHVMLDEDLDELGSVSVRTPDYFTMLFACAVVD